MHLRFARHTNNLDRIKHFYVDILGLSLLGNFENHDGYDGIFIGRPNADWHLEFTQTDDLPQHEFDEDDLLVLYPITPEDYQTILSRLSQNNILSVQAKNPYWNHHAKMFIDPDGYRVVISDQKIKE